MEQAIQQELDTKAVQDQAMQDQIQQQENFNRNISQIKKQLKANYSLNEVCRMHALALVELQYLKDVATGRDQALKDVYTQVAGLKLELGHDLSVEEQDLIKALKAQPEVANEEAKTEAQ